MRTGTNLVGFRIGRFGDRSGCAIASIGYSWAGDGFYGRNAYMAVVRGVYMVESALLVPERVVQGVAGEYGEASIEALQEAFSEGELECFERECREDPEKEVVVFAALEPIERERVIEAAEEAGQRPGEWLMEATRDVGANEGPVVGHTSIEHAVEDAIVRRA